MSTERIHSYYNATVNSTTRYPKLEGELRVDVAVIGGGFTGLATALELAEQGKRVALVEAHRIGWGQSGRNGGQVTGSLSGDGAILRQLTRQAGTEVAEEFIWNLRWRGQDIIRQRIARYGIECDLKYGHLHAAYKPGDMHAMCVAYEELVRRDMGDMVELVEARDMGRFLATPLYHGGIYNQRNLHLHPLNLCLGEARALASLGGLIFEQSPVLEIIHGATPALRLEGGRIVADQILLAGDVSHKLERRKLSGMIFPAAGGIVATAPLGELARQINPQDVAVYDSRFVLDYYRTTADGRLLFGGGANYSGKASRDIAAELRPCIERTFPQLRGVQIDYQWSCDMGIVINRIPQLGKLAHNVWYAQGYSGHGLATSHIVGEVMAKAIAGTMDQFDVFQRFSHVRAPVGDWLGRHMLALGMWYFVMLERLR
ncbi:MULTISPECIES: FAD-binding oxidoreductase [unclassified Duganella]|uniref:NAD(P)/FAD-dependent oxidoreductase n=1 Tax=unclassified Duganella TaxID=2636909 RepID=UPI000E341E37|nr:MULTISPECIES: FAD-binding oxidoreductase [unclassified Duganella]RFP19242.1 FAD-binding oxidoreductase [Duganella sp. BJB475]RFP35823.1 FAD-binding oxidoreductase [Duganella sp. BJB476]